MIQGDPQALCELFRAHEPRIAQLPLTDFSGLQRSIGTFCEVSPTSIDEACGIVRQAHRHGVPLRMRGQGHALNGSSLPTSGELLIHTRRLCGVRCEQEGTVSAGAGIVLWTLRSLLERHGWSLPVVNDGYAGPSAGGFIASGGFGSSSDRYGGFWDNVAEVTLLNGRGELQRVSRGEPLFRWLFGAMGQLGWVVEVRLDLVPTGSGSPAPYPKGLQLGFEQVLQYEAGLHFGPPESERGRRLYWFTLFAPPAERQQALALLARLEAQHPGTFHYLQRYLYPIRRRDGIPPLIYPADTDFLALGSWGFHEEATPEALERLRRFDEDFMVLATREGYRRYIQSELPSNPAVYERYFGSELYAGLRSRRLQQDPGAMFNRGWVFPER